jgi:hypothetical protein
MNRGNLAAQLPPGLMPTDPRSEDATLGGLVRAKVQTARYNEFRRQTAHVADGMQNLERVQKSIIELSLIQKHGEKRAAELTRDIAGIEEETMEIRAAGQRKRELYPELLALERAGLRAERQKYETAAQLTAMEPERAAIALRVSAAEADKAELVNRSEGKYIAAVNEKNAAIAECETALLRAKTAAELGVLRADSVEPILPKERAAWEEQKVSRTEQRELEQRKQALVARTREASEVIAAQAIAGAVQLPEVSPYSAYAWLTYQQEYDRFRGDHDKALEATIGHLVKRMSNGGISRADAEVTYKTYKLKCAEHEKDTNHAQMKTVFESLGVVDARN